MRLIRSICRGMLPAAVIVGISGCNSADMPTNVIYSCDEYTVYADSVVSGAYTVRAVSPLETEAVLADGDTCATVPALSWKLKAADSRFPQFDSDALLPTAMYNRAIARMAEAMHGEVSTGDISYSMLLSMACIDPELAMKQLRSHTEDGCIAMDNGSGYPWPISSGHIVWALAAYEVYKVTGDRRWLEEMYHVVKKTLDRDMPVIMDPHLWLICGSPSYAGQEETYPEWMQPADIYASVCLGTNALFTRVFQIMGEASDILGYDGTGYRRMAGSTITAINNNLWIPNLGYYSQYLYGGVYPIQSQATDNTGQALAILFGIANTEMSRSILSKTPVLQSGTPAMFPQPYGVEPHSGDISSPLVQILWNMAAARTGNMAALEAGLGAFYRSAAMTDTAAHSGNALAGAAGAAIVTRIYAGMSFQHDGIHFNPVIPPMLTGEKRISNFRYRHADLTIVIKGTGTRMRKFSINGKPASDMFFASTHKGKHTIEITMADNRPEASSVNISVPGEMPATPVVTWSDPHSAEIVNFITGMSYNVYLNGMFEAQIQTSGYSLYDAKEYTVTAMVPVENETTEGYTMRPHEFIPDSSLTVIEAESIARPGTRLIKDRKEAARFAELSPYRNTRIAFTVNAPEAGEYFIDVHYANGNGPAGKRGSCAIRRLTVNGTPAGSIVMPSRGTLGWTETGRSNMLRIRLAGGMNRLSIERETPYAGDSADDTVLLDCIRIIKQ